MKLYQWQKEAIKTIRENPGKNFLITAPTSAGKTLINYYFLGIFDGENFVTPKEKVIYTVPIKSLANDKFFELKEIGIDVGIQTGDITLNPEAPVVVCTQEVYQAVYKGKGYKVVIDEFHYAFQNPQRALSYVSLSPSDQYLLSSATIKVTDALLKYLQTITGREIIHYHTDFRPTKLEFQQEPLTPENVAQIYTDDNLVLSVAFTRNNLQTVAWILETYLDELPQEKIQQILKLAKRFGLTEESLSEIFPQWRYGIFIYHGKLSYSQKVFVEQLAKSKLARTVVSTDAISLGVNFPISDIVFYQLTKFDGREWRTLYPSEFLQISGRAGRKGFYEVGRVWSVVGYLDVDDFANTYEIYKQLLKSKLEDPRIDITLSLTETFRIIERLLPDELKGFKLPEDILTAYSLETTYPKLYEQLQTLANQLMEVLESYSRYSFPKEATIPWIDEQFIADILELMTDIDNSPAKNEFWKIISIKEIDPVLIDLSTGTVNHDAIGTGYYALKLAERLKSEDEIDPYMLLHATENLIGNYGYTQLLIQALKILRRTNSTDKAQRAVKFLLDELKQNDPIVYELLSRSFNKF